jgi:hypothetical protein
MNINITDIAQYAGWLFLAFFVGIGLFIIIGLYLESSKNKKAATVNPDGTINKTKEDKNTFKSIGTKRALRQDKKDKKSISNEALAQNIFTKQQDKQAPIAFAPKAGSASVKDISAGLTELNGATSSNPFRTPVDDEDAFLQQNHQPEKSFSEPTRYDYGSDYDKPEATKVTPPVAETPKVVVPSVPGPPPVISSSSKPSGFVIDERNNEGKSETKPAPFRRPLPPPPNGLK